MPSSCPRALSVSFVIVILVSTCAKRMSPPSPDRFAPHLELVQVLGRSRLDLVFDEQLDPSGIPTESLVISAADGSRLSVRGVTVSRTGERLLVWTEPQSSGMYRLEAYVADFAGNVAKARGRFRGSSAVDTIAPRVASVRPGPGQAAYMGDDIQYDFSEPMDTLTAPVLLTLPRSLAASLQPSWDPGWQRLSLGRKAIRSGSGLLPRAVFAENDSVVLSDEPREAGSPEIRSTAVRYILLLPGLADFEGNRTRQPTLSSYTRDSVVPEASVSGWIEGPGPSVVFFSTDSTEALAVTDDSGLFSLSVNPGVYQVTAVSDTDRDGLADLAGRLAVFNTDSESLRLLLEAEPEPNAIGRYLR